MPTDSVFGDRAENQGSDAFRLELDGCTSSFGALFAATSSTFTAVYKMFHGTLIYMVIT